MNIFSCSFYWLVFITGGLKNRASERAAEEVAGERSLWQPKPFSAPPGCQQVEDPLIREGQAGGVILLPFNTHQKLLGSPEDSENVSLTLGFSFCCSRARGSLSRCSCERLRAA